MYLREGFHIFNFYKAVKDRNHDKKCIYSDYILLNESKCSLLLVCNPIFIEGPATQRAWLHNMLKIHPVPCWYIFTCIYKDIWGNISCDFMFILICNFKVGNYAKLFIAPTLYGWKVNWCWKVMAPTHLLNRSSR